MNVFYKGLVHPWLCDVMGHLTTRHYMAMFDEASYQLLSESTGWQPGSYEWKDIGWADVRHEIEYKAELVVGTLIEISGGIEKTGNSSLTAYYEMKTKATGEVAATMLAKTVLFDLGARKAMALTDAIRSKLRE